MKIPVVLISPFHWKPKIKIR